MTIHLAAPLPAVDRLQTAKDLETTADILDDVGLHKNGGLYDTAQYDTHHIGRSKCRQDIHGAIRTAIIGTPTYTDDRRMLARIDATETALADHLRYDRAELADWFDVRQRQTRQVVKALREAAAGQRGDDA
ncbi:MAG: hypothetical protein HOV68_23710 [Streptomycetaceae bacterium]|nr:hypothetical protein [Streptomycetaceae bacterium]